MPPARKFVWKVWPSLQGACAAAQELSNGCKLTAVKCKYYDFIASSWVYLKNLEKTEIYLKIFTIKKFLGKRYIESFKIQDWLL